MRLPGVLIGIALLSLTGLSACAEPRPGLDEVTSVGTAPTGTRIVVSLDRPNAEEQLWFVNDAGQVIRGSLPSAPAAKSSDCAGNICYRVVRGQLRVEQSYDTGRSRTIPDVGMFPGAFYSALVIGLVVVGGLLTVTVH